MQHTDKALSDFNAWWDRQPFRDQFEDMKQQMANVWVASRRELVIDLPEVECFGDHWSGGWNDMRDEAKDAIEAAGVTVRG